MAVDLGAIRCHTRGLGGSRGFALDACLLDDGRVAGHATILRRLAPDRKFIACRSTDMETLGGFALHSAPTTHPATPSLRSASPNLPAMVRAEQGSAAPHALVKPARGGLGESDCHDGGGLRAQDASAQGNGHETSLGRVAYLRMGESALWTDQ